MRDIAVIRHNGDTLACLTLLSYQKDNTLITLSGYPSLGITREYTALVQCSEQPIQLQYFNNTNHYYTGRIIALDHTKRTIRLTIQEGTIVISKEKKSKSWWAGVFESLRSLWPETAGHRKSSARNV